MSTILKASAQKQGSQYRGLPVEEKNDSSLITTVTGETVQFFYSNAGVRTQDAGQAAGVAVEAVLARNNIKNSQGKTIGSSIDTSLSFTSTAFTSEVVMDLTILESLDDVSWADRLATLTAGLSNGQYVFDYQKGIAYGKKASTQTSLTSTTYKVMAETLTATVDTTGLALESTLELIEEATHVEDTTHTTGDRGMFALAVRNNAGTALAGDGDYTGVTVDANNALWTTLRTLISGEDQANALMATMVRPIATSTHSATRGQNNSFTTTNVKASAGRLYYVTVINTTGSSRYFQIHNTATTPAGGATALAKWLVPANSQIVLQLNDLGMNGLYCDTGIAIANSTAAATYTAGSAGDLLVDYNYA